MLTNIFYEEENEMIPKPMIIDISEWQDPSQMNYDKLASQINGVIIRIQYGSLYTDKHFKKHILEFKKRKIPIAVYAWVRGTSKSDMAQEARDFYQKATEYTPSFWWLDVEEKSMPDMRTGCETYRATLKQLGAKKVGVYVANHLFHEFQLAVNKFDGLWVPTYGQNTGDYQGSDPTATSLFDLHQYTSCGKLAGYSGFLDFNRIVQKGFDYFFDAKVKEEKAGIVMKTLKTTAAYVHLRSQPEVSNNVIARLPKGADVAINDIVIANGFVWGVQPRADGSVGYVDIGQSVPWIK